MNTLKDKKEREEAAVVAERFEDTEQKKNIKVEQDKDTGRHVITVKQFDRFTGQETTPIVMNVSRQKLLERRNKIKQIAAQEIAKIDKTLAMLEEAKGKKGK